MNHKELVRKLVVELGEQAAPDQVLARAGDIIKETLIAGDAADLFGLFRVKLEPLALTGTIYGKDSMSIIPLPALLRSARHARDGKEPQRRTVALLVDKLTPILKIEERQLRGPQNQRQTFTVTGITGLAKLMNENRIDAIVAESTFSELAKLRYWLKVDRMRSRTALFILYQEGDRPPLDDLTVAEDAALYAPFNEKEINDMIDSETERVLGEHNYFTHLTEFYLPPRPDLQESAADLIAALCRQSGLTEEGVLGTTAAFREALDNAMRHGCAGIENAVVRVNYTLDRQKMVIMVQDPGKGFRSAEMLSQKISSDAIMIARERNNEGLRGGLGMMLMLKGVDRLEYNQIGNITILTKFLPTGE